MIRRSPERLRPLELLGIALGCALFVGAIVLLVSRQIVLAGEFALVGFVVALVGLAMLDLAISPKEPTGSDAPEESAAAEGESADGGEAAGDESTPPAN